MRFYIASSTKNLEMAAALAGVLRSRGHEQTYDWTQHGDIREEGELMMSEVAFNELRAVRDAEMLIVLLPGGGGTHTELGVGIATRNNKRIVIWSESGDEFSDPDKTCAFYFHPSVERIVCPFGELLVRFDREHFDSEI